VAAVEPNHVLLGESALGRLNANLLFTWGLGEHALPVIEFMLERYPSSRGAQALLAEGHMLAGHYPAAIDAYGKYLEQYPDDSIARARLEWLRSRQ
jgi:tetratricopeptide (TPR) repeat protein